MAETQDYRSTNALDIINFVSNHNDTYPAIDPLKADLTGKAVVITGASKGIGYATAISFARAGCSKIAVSARTSLQSLEKDILEAAEAAGRKRPTIISMESDVTSEADVKRFATAVEQGFGGAVDVLINNAGYLENWVPFVESNPSEWWKTWEVNIKGLYLCSRYFLPMVLKSETKTVISMTSMGGNLTAMGASAYQTTKFAVCRLAEFMSNEHWDDGIISIAVHPGGVATAMGLSMPKELHFYLTDTPELPADAMVWFAKERRDWLRGRYVSANWDVEELEGKKDEIVKKDLLKFRLTT